MAAGCSDDEPRATTTTTTTVPAVGVIEPGLCGAGNCPVEVLIDGVTYGLGCGAVRADAVTEAVVARGDDHIGDPIVAHRIRGVEASVALAVDRPGGYCGGDDVVTSDWSFAFAASNTQAATTAAVCVAGYPNETERPAC